MSKPIIKLRNTWSVVEKIPYEVAEELYELLSFDVPGAHWSPKYIDNVIDEEEKKNAWDGKIHLFYKGGNVFLTGLTFKVCEFFKNEYGIIPELIWEMTEPRKNLNLQWNEKDFSLRPYQKEIVSNCIKKKRAIIEACTGSGKTLMIGKIIQELGVSPFVFYVLTKDLMYQSKKMLEKTILGLEVGLIGDGKCDIRDVTIVTVQSAIASFEKSLTKKMLKEIQESAEMDDNEFKEFKKENLDHVQKKREDIQNFIKSANGIYADEVHHYSSKTCKSIILKSKKAFYRFGGSATPTRADNSYLTIEGLFGRKTAIVTASDLILKGYLTKPTIRFIELKEKQKWVNTWDQDRSAHIVENETRNECVIKLANDFSKRNIQTLILVQLIKHGKDLEKRIPNSVFIYGGSSKKKREQALEDIQSGKLKILIGSTIADEGLDIPALSALILAGGGKSPTRAKQRVGRVIRKGSSQALVYDFIDDGKWSYDHSKERLKILKEEPEFDVKVISVKDVLSPYKDLF